MEAWERGEPPIGGSPLPVITLLRRKNKKEERMA